MQNFRLDTKVVFEVQSRLWQRQRAIYIFDLIFFCFVSCATVDRARASFKTKFGSMGLRDRGLRLAGYLTPPSDVTQEEEETNERYTNLYFCNILQ